MNKTKLPESLEIGQWIITKDGRTVKITGDDTPNLSYDDIERLATEEEIPEFIFKLGDAYGLNEKDFWEPLSKKLPVPHKMFFTWLAQYKKSIKWQTVSFTELPFDMQVGVIFNFIASNYSFEFYDCQYNRDSIVDIIISGFQEIDIDIKNKAQ